jgi:hypothetical protein
VDVQGPHRIDTSSWSSPAYAVAGLQDAAGIQASLSAESKLFYDDIVSSYSARLRSMLVDACGRRLDGSSSYISKAALSPTPAPQLNALLNPVLPDRAHNTLRRTQSMPIMRMRSSDNQVDFEGELASIRDLPRDISMPVASIHKVALEKATKQDGHQGVGSTRAGSDGRVRSDGNGREWRESSRAGDTTRVARTQSIPNMLDLGLNHSGREAVEAGGWGLFDEDALRHAEGRRSELSTALPIHTAEDSMDMGTLSFFMQNYCTSLTVLADALQTVLYEEIGRKFAPEQRGF